MSFLATAWYRLCGHRFPNERKQQTHMAVVHEQELSAEELASLTRVRHQRCPDCPFATYSALQFRQHRATHTGRYPFACTHCTRAFAFRSVNDFCPPVSEWSAFWSINNLCLLVKEWSLPYG